MKNKGISNEKEVQDFVEIFDIKDSSIINDDQERIMLFEIYPLNRDLLSIDEQEEIVTQTTFALKDLVNSYDFNSKIYPVDNTSLIEKQQDNFNKEKDQTIKGYILKHIDFLNKNSIKNSLGERKYILKVYLPPDDDILRLMETIASNLMKAFEKYKCHLKQLNDSGLILDSILFAKLNPNMPKIDLTIETGRSV